MHTTANNLDQDVLPVVTCLLKVLNVSLFLHSNMFRMTPMIMEENKQDLLQGIKYCLKNAVVHHVLHFKIVHFM